MRLIVFWVGCCGVISLVCGCQKAQQTDGGIPNAVDVIVEGGGQMPSWLAGRWKGQKNWEMVFEPDGRISEAKHSIGGILVKPKHLTTLDDKEKKVKNRCRAGRWRVHYLPDERELRVEIVLDYVYLEWGPVVLEGKARDEFIGQISEDGKIWKADWFSFAEYRIPGQDSVVAPKPDEVFMGVITFKKLEEDK